MNHPLTESPNAWLDGSGKTPLPIGRSCSIGRSPQNQVVLTDRKASRRHAVVHLQGKGEYWLVDFGSTNGTTINDRRVFKPTLLHDRDRVLIGDECFIFRQDAANAPPEMDSATTNFTAREIKIVDCWLLVADVEDSTRLSQTMPADELPVVLGRWFASCKETIDSHFGQINKYLGDGFFAFWVEDPLAAEQVAQAAQKLTQAQAPDHLPFRWVLHNGPVSVGGNACLNEESLLGREVHFAFRMEALAGQLNLSRLLSDSARAKLPWKQPLQDIGLHSLSGFDGTHHFHTF